MKQESKRIKRERKKAKQKDRERRLLGVKAPEEAEQPETRGSNPVLWMLGAIVLFGVAVVVIVVTSG